MNRSNERDYSLNLINYNINTRNKKLTTTPTAINQLSENVICSYIGCNDHANSNITLKAGTRIFNLKVCNNCKKKLEL